MGRTVLPFSQVIRVEQERWKKFRRALRKEDQQLLDALFARAQQQIQAAVYASFPEPLFAIFMTLLLEHEREIRRLREEVARLCRAG